VQAALLLERFEALTVEVQRATAGEVDFVLAARGRLASYIACARRSRHEPRERREGAGQDEERVEGGAHGATV